MKKKIILPVLTIVGISLILVGTSYAYWRFTYISDKTNIGKSKCLSIELTNQKNEISLTNTYPINDIEGKKLTPYSFTINNTCDTFISYDVNLEILEGTTMNSKYMAVMINNEHKELLSNLDSANTVMSSSVESKKLVSGSLGVGDSVDYTLRLWMDESVTLSDDAMNKSFTSKIVVTAQPSNYSPKEAGYDTLHDAILANEYQTTPEKAIEKIKAKGEPDLSKTAPIIKWVEKNGESTTRQVIKPTVDAINSIDGLSDLSINEQYMRICTAKTFDSNTAKYSLSDCSLRNPTTLDYSEGTKYYYSTEYMSYNQSNQKLYVSRSYDNTIIYQITGATMYSGTQTTGDITYDTNVYDLHCIILTEIEQETDKSDNGLYRDTDDYGSTYYYRGNVKNNNVYFAGFYWQIVRINGNGSIRLIYNGLVKNSTGIAQSINNSVYKFNSKYNNPTYIGYMYGNSEASTFEEIHANINDSTVKSAIDTWYKTNIEDLGYGEYVSNNAGFCGDRTISSGGDGIQTNVNTYFGAYGRSLKNIIIFTCPTASRDFYTSKDSSIGNKSLIYPVGLITYDEMVYAGMNRNQINKLSWIYSAQNTWTMSPSYFWTTGGLAIEWFGRSNGSLDSDKVSSGNIARPVINLKSDVKISGGIGTSNDPYVVDTNN